MVDPEAAREAAREILARPEYAEPQPGIVERVVEWVFDRAGSFLGTLTGGGPGSVIGWLIVIALASGAAWLVVRALRVPLPGGVVDQRSLSYDTEVRRSAEEWRREADRLAAAGDHRGALRCRYQAMLAGLAGAGVVDDVPGRTAGEYEDILRRRLPHRRDDLHEVTDRFERAWYGGEPVTADALDRFTVTATSIERDRAVQDVVGQVAV